MLKKLAIVLGLLIPILALAQYYNPFDHDQFQRPDPHYNWGGKPKYDDNYRNRLERHRKEYYNRYREYCEHHGDHKCKGWDEWEKNQHWDDNGYDGDRHNR